MNIYDYLAEYRAADKRRRAYAVLGSGAAPERAAALREAVELAAASLPDETALEAAELFPLWNGGGADYQAGNRVRFDGALYRCLLAHSSQAAWSPAASPSLWTRVLIPDPELIPDWVQPDSTNSYAKGDRVRHNGKLWRSDLDGNVWEPGVHGWTEIV